MKKGPLHGLQQALFYQSENFFYEHFGQRIHGFFFIGTFCNQADTSALGDTHGKNTQQALCIDTAIIYLDTDAGLELIGLLQEVGCLTVIQTGFAFHD